MQLVISPGSCRRWVWRSPGAVRSGPCWPGRCSRDCCRTEPRDEPRSPHATAGEWLDMIKIKIYCGLSIWRSTTWTHLRTTEVWYRWAPPGSPASIRCSSLWLLVCPTAWGWPGPGPTGQCEAALSLTDPANPECLHVERNSHLKLFYTENWGIIR